jgi:hypothetical protein
MAAGIIGFYAEKQFIVQDLSVNLIDLERLSEAVAPFSNNCFIYSP